jgi:alkaline phosphatase
VLLPIVLPACGPAAGRGGWAAGREAADARGGPSAVLFIADGMGQAYVTAARLARGREGRLRLDEMPHTAIMKTWAVDSPVTDSAAAASAMACGRKTLNEVICEDADARPDRAHGRRLQSIAVWAKARGLRVGILTTARVTHATPAAFYATHHDRDAERDIARQAIEARLDFLLGGGRREFERSPADGEDLLDLARARGWRVAGSAADLRAIADLERPVLGLFAPGHLPYEPERWAAETKARAAGAAGGGPADGPPGLVEMTRWGIARLRATGDPFLLIVEGGRPDHAGHDNRARTLVDEMTAFDDAVGLAIDGLDPGATLVLATGDHETGGLAINGYPTWETGVWGWTRGYGADYPVLSFASGPGMRGPADDSPYGKDDLRVSGIPLSDGLHTGVDLPLYAWGAGAGQVRGTLENTAVYHLLRAHLEGRPADRGALVAAPSPPL